MDRCLVDTAIFVYARGRDHPYRSACRSLVDRAASRRPRFDASVEMVQEYLHLVLRRGGPRDDALAEAHEVASVCELHPFDTEVLARVTALLGEYPFLGERDAVHAATALEHGIDVVLSTDRVFDRIAGLRRLDPLAAIAELRPGVDVVGAPHLASGTPVDMSPDTGRNPPDEGEDSD